MLCEHQNGKIRGFFIPSLQSQRAISNSLSCSPRPFNICQCFTIQLGMDVPHAQQREGLIHSGGMRASHLQGSELQPEMQMSKPKLPVVP